MPLDRTKLAKLLGLAASDNDHEAMGALRAATRLVKAENMSWEDVLAGPEKTFRVSIQRQTMYDAEEQEAGWVAPHLKDKVMIDLMFRSVYSQPRTGSEDFWRWVDDVHEKWQRYNQLTPGQYTALRKCYSRTLKTR